MELEVIKQLAEISISVGILIAIVFYGLKRFTTILESHREEREKADEAFTDRFKELEESHREERKLKDENIRDMDIYTRQLTKETYDLMAEVSRQLQMISIRSDEEKKELKDLIVTSKVEGHNQLLIMLEIIGDKLGIENRKFFNT